MVHLTHYGKTKITTPDLHLIRAKENIKKSHDVPVKDKH